MSNNDGMRLWAGLAAAAVLIVAPSALAKGPDTARICGESGCTTVDSVEDVNVLALYTSGFQARSEPGAAPFFNVDLTSSFGARAEWSFLYVPSARAVKIIRADFSGGVAGVQTQNSWVTPTPDVLAAYERATDAMSPFPANEQWIAPKSDGADIPWAIVGLGAVMALLVAGLLFTRRVGARRTATATPD